jgi:hypothetical protein
MTDVILDKFGDHGAESSRRDEFQKHYAAFWCLEMLEREDITEVICEYGEDIVVTSNNSYELHQVKTRQESMSDWQLEDLMHVFAKSFAIAYYFGNVSKCCFISNEGSKGVLFDLKLVLSKAPSEWNEDEKNWFNQFCRNHSERILKLIGTIDPDTHYSIEDIERLLLLLDVKTDFHHMEYIQDSNMRRLRRFIENTNNNGNNVVLTDDEIIEVYERLMGLIGKATIGKSREEKTLTKQLILENIKVAIINRKTQYRFPTAEEIASAPGDTKLEQKLQLGGFTPEFILNAREVMVEILHKARTWEFGLSESVFEDVRFRMKYYCTDAFDKICQSYPTKEKIGRSILDELKKEFPNLIEYYKDSSFPIDDLFLLGTAWILTSECKAYWSQQRVD